MTSPDTSARTITSLTGTYRVKAPAIFTDEECAEAVRQLEEAGKLPHRSLPRGPDGKPSGGIRISMGQAIVEVAGYTCDVVIFGKLVGIVPVRDGEPDVIAEAERIARKGA